MKILALLFLVQCQVDTIPAIDQLYASLATYYEQKTEAELAEFQETKKGEWLKYIPSVGVTYTLDNKPRPSASFSTSVLYRAKQDKQARAAKRKAIIQTNQLAHQQDKIRLTQLWKQYELEEDALRFQTDIFEIDKTLFEIDEAKYKVLEIPPSEFLKIKRAYLVKGFELRELRKEIQLLEAGILVAAKWVE